MKINCIYLLFIVLATLVFTSCSKQRENTNTVYGILVHPTFPNGEVKPVANNQVTLENAVNGNEKFTTISDAGGNYEFDHILTGKYLVISYYTDTAGNYYSGVSNARLYNNTKDKLDLYLSLTGK